MKHERLNKKIKNWEFKDSKEMISEMEAPILVEMKKEHEELMMDDPLQKKENMYLQLDQNDISNNETGGPQFESNYKGVLRFKENPDALKILQDSEFSLENPDIDVTSVSDLGLQNLSSQNDIENFRQISLGKVDVLKANSISLKDVDVENIPDDLEIDIDPLQKEATLVGQRIDPNRTDESFRDFYEQELKNDDENDFDPTIQKFKKEIFIEKSFEEIKREKLGEFWGLGYVENIKRIFQSKILFLPVILFFWILINEHLTFLSCANSVYKVDLEEILVLKEYKKASLKSN